MCFPHVSQKVGKQGSIRKIFLNDRKRKQIQEIYTKSEKKRKNVNGRLKEFSFLDGVFHKIMWMNVIWRGRKI